MDDRSLGVEQGAVIGQIWFRAGVCKLQILAADKLITVRSNVSSDVTSRRMEEKESLKNSRL